MPGAYIGECSAGDINNVYINTSLADDVERRFNWFNVRQLERTVLHELVHWARFVGKLPAEINGKEAGSWFGYRGYDIDYVGHSEFSCSNA